MTAYRFRVRIEWDPSSFWRDIVIGGERTLEEFQNKIHDSSGLDQDHLWFFGSDQDYWRSNIKYQCPTEYEDLPSGARTMGSKDEVYNASETKINDLRMKKGDRLCYLFDYGDEWQFYAILKELMEDEPNDKEPKVIKKRGKKLIQYPAIDEEPKPSEEYRYHPWHIE